MVNINTFFAEWWLLLLHGAAIQYWQNPAQYVCPVNMFKHMPPSLFQALNEQENYS
jgi:hypothetical protein